MIPLTNKEKKSYEKKKVCYIRQKEFSTNKKYRKVRDHCHYTGKFRGVAHNNCNLRYKIPKEILIVFHTGSAYDYHFIIEQLSTEVNGKFDCLGENTEKYITFSASIYKKNDNDETFIYKLKLLIALDLCQPYCQVLLVTCQRFTKRMQIMQEKIKDHIIRMKFYVINDKFVLLIRKGVSAGKNLMKHHYQVKKLFTAS